VILQHHENFVHVMLAGRKEVRDERA